MVNKPDMLFVPATKPGHREEPSVPAQPAPETQPALETPESKIAKPFARKNGGKIPSLEKLKVLDVKERVSADQRERGETPSGNLERIAAECDTRAQEKLLSHNTGLFNRMKNVASRAWGAVKGFFGSIKEDIVLPVRDAVADVFTGRKENTAGVAELDNRIDDLHSAIANAEGKPQLQDDLMKQYDALKLQRERLVDPRALARREAAEAKEQQAAEQAEAIAFLKSEEERLKIEGLASAVEAAQEAHRVKVERAAEARAAKINLGRGAAILLVRAAGEDPEKMEMSERMALGIGAIIEGAKTAVVEGIRTPGYVKAGFEATKADVKEGAAAAYEKARYAARGMVMADDLGEAYKNVKEAAGASISLTGAVLMNKPVQDKLLEYLGQERTPLIAGDEEGDATVEEIDGGTRDVLIKAMKSGALESAKAIGNAVAETWAAIRDSEKTKATKESSKRVALGVSAILASPILIPVMGGYFAGKGIAKGYNKTMDVIDENFDLNALVEGIANAPDTAKREAMYVAKGAHDVLMTTAEDINKNTTKATEAYKEFSTKLSILKKIAVMTYHRLEAEAISEAARAKNPELVTGIESAIDDEEQCDTVDDLPGLSQSQNG